MDPFELMKIEENKGHNDINIVSILSQDGVEAIFSGVLIIKKEIENDIIEGVLGKGDAFMVGDENIYKITDI